MSSPLHHVDYDGDLSRVYEPGRSISPEAEETWRAAVRPHLAHAGTGAVCDIGAGTGRFARLFGDLVDHSVVAVEPAHGMRAVAGEVSQHPAVYWVAGTAEGIPLAASSASVIWSAFATHYFDLPAAAHEFRRVLQSDGRVLLWHAFEDVWDQLEWYRWFPTARDLDEERMPTFDQVAAAFADAGLDLVARSTQSMLIAQTLDELADRLSHRAISTLKLISDEQFETGLADLRAYARANRDTPVYSPNVLAVFQPK